MNSRNSILFVAQREALPKTLADGLGQTCVIHTAFTYPSSTFHGSFSKLTSSKVATHCYVNK